MPSNNQIADWQDSVLQGHELATYGTLAAMLNVLGTIGPPELEYMPEFIDSGEGGSGTSERLLTEFAVGKIVSSISHKTRLDEVRAYYAMRSLFQSLGTTVAGPPVKTTFNPWTIQPATNRGTSIIANATNDTLASGAVQMLGCIAESVELESSEGSFVTMSTKYRGTTSTLVAATSSGTSEKGTVSHMHHLNQLVATGSGLNIKPAKMKVMLTNNLKAFFGTSQTPTDLAMGNFGAKGSYTIPYKTFGVPHQAIALARSTMKLTHTFFSATLTGGVVIELDVVLEDAKMTEENGLKMLEFPWTAAKSASTTKVEVFTATDLVAT